MTIKEQIEKLKEKFPTVQSFIAEYSGSGDQFDEMWEVETKSTDDKQLTCEDVEDLLWYAINHSEANFNNDGSKGTVTIDFENKKLSIDNYYYVSSTEASGELEFENEEFEGYED